MEGPGSAALASLAAALALVAVWQAVGFLRWVAGFVYVYFLRPAVNPRSYGAWAVVTGATDGIGEALSHRLAQKGERTEGEGRGGEGMWCWPQPNPAVNRPPLRRHPPLRSARHEHPAGVTLPGAAGALRRRAGGAAQRAAWTCRQRGPRTGRGSRPPWRACRWVLGAGAAGTGWKCSGCALWAPNPYCRALDAVALAHYIGPLAPPRLPQVGILVNNAGAFYKHPDHLETLTDEWVQGHLCINCLAPTMVRGRAVWRCAAPSGAWRCRADLARLSCPAVSLGTLLQPPPSPALPAASGLSSPPRPPLPALPSSARWCCHA